MYKGRGDRSSYFHYQINQSNLALVIKYLRLNVLFFLKD